jgi:type II secretory pathway pseudopilin PulG
MQTTSGRENVIQRLIDRGDLSPRALRHLNSEWGRRMLRERLEMSDLPDAQKALLLQAEGVTLEARTGPGNEARAQSVQRARQGLMPLLWIATIVVCGIALLLAVAPRRIVEVLVVLVIILVLIAILLPSLGKARELSNRSVAAAEAAGLVQALQVAKADGEVFGTAGQAADEPRLRQYFPETLLWCPELITDAQGNASLEVPLADSITTWRLTSSAVTAGGELGALETPIRVFQPFFIDLDLPPALTRQDEVTVPVVVYNYLSTPQQVRVVVKPADWYERLPEAADEGGGEISLAPRGVGSVKLRMRVLKAGTHTLQVSAGSGAVADALQRTVLVVPDGERRERVTNGTVVPGEPAEVAITLPPEVIEQSAYAAIKLYPTTFSQLVEGLDSIFQMPHGCFEQTSSTTYPNVLALDSSATAGRNGMAASATGSAASGAGSPAPCAASPTASSAAPTSSATNSANPSRASTSSPATTASPSTTWSPTTPPITSPMARKAAMAPATTAAGTAALRAPAKTPPSKNSAPNRSKTCSPPPYSPSECPCSSWAMRSAAPSTATTTPTARTTKPAGSIGPSSKSTTTSIVSPPS